MGCRSDPAGAAGLCVDVDLPKKQARCVMFVDVRAMGFRLTDAIGAHVESRVTAAVRALARGVLGVTARLEDVNADRGGVDKRCTLVASVRGRRTVAVEAVDRDLYVAVDKASQRMRRMAQRLLRRRVGRERSARE